MVHTFNRITVEDSPLGPTTCLGISSWLGKCTRYMFHCVEWDLNPIRKWLINPMTIVPLLYQWACLDRQVVLVV